MKPPIPLPIPVPELALLDVVDDEHYAGRMHRSRLKGYIEATTTQQLDEHGINDLANAALVLQLRATPASLHRLSRQCFGRQIVNALVSVPVQPTVDEDWTRMDTDAATSSMRVRLRSLTR